MTPVTAPIALYAYIGGAWTLLDDVAPIDMRWGMGDNRPISRVADTGELSFALNNSTGQYSPNGPSVLAGWKKGIPVKAVFTYDAEEYIRFRGVISDINHGELHDPKVHVTVLDWLDYAARHPIVNPGIQTNKRGDEVLTTVKDLIEIAPQAYDFDAGTETFPNVFDTVTSKTKAYSEFAKVAFSELGYVYLKKDRENGETLRFEAADARHGWRTPDEIPLATEESGFALNEDGDFAINEDGGFALNNETGAPPTMDGTIWTDYEAPYGEHVINRMTVYAYPRKLDTSPQVLFTLSTPIAIGSGQTYTLKGTYADPAGGLPINGQDMVTPVVTTDYLMNTASDGSGSNISADLSISITYGTEGFTAILTNGNAATGYVTKFNTRGTGIYTYNPIEHAATNSESIGEFEYSSETIYQKYKDTLYSGRAYVDSQVDEHKQPRTVLNSISFVANKSNDCMMTFLNTDIGDLRYISIPEIGIAGNYYVQGIEVEVKGTIIFVKWIVLLALSLQTGCGLSPVAVEFGGEAATDGINFGPLPAIANSDARTFSAWVYPVAESPDIINGVIMGIYSGAASFVLVSERLGAESITFNIKYSPSGQGAWNTPSNSLTYDAWHHVVVTKARNLTTGDAPTIYIDGVAQTLTVLDAPELSVAYPEDGANFVIGNFKSSVVGYTAGFKGKIFDPRVYDRILTADEVTAIYNSGTPDEAVGTKDGLVFQAFAVRTDELSAFVDQTLDDTMKLKDNIRQYVGTPHGNPIGRAAP